MAWWQSPRIDNFGFFPDPVGNYPKPDSNFIGLADGTPITALGAGTVTGTRVQPWGPQAYSITVKLDQPYNSVATHMAYNYVSNPQVHPGQHVDFGTILAFSGNPYGIGTAFAFCDADLYGTATKNEPFSGTYINPLLNPVPFLDALNKNGAPPASSTSQATGLAGFGETVLKEVGVPQQAIDAINVANGGAMTWIGGGIVATGLAAGAGVLFLLTGGL